MIILALESRNPLVDSINLIDQRNYKNATGSFTERHNDLELAQKVIFDDL